MKHWQNVRNDVRNDLLEALAMGIVVAVCAAIMVAEDPSIARIGICIYAGMAALPLQLCFWDFNGALGIYGVGRRARIATGLGNNLAYLLPFSIAVFLV